jgi:hypothetical protein
MKFTAKQLLIPVAAIVIFCGLQTTNVKAALGDLDPNFGAVRMHILPP